MNYEVYHIPSNFTDAGRVFGLFEMRNVIETVLLGILHPENREGHEVL